MVDLMMVDEERDRDSVWNDMDLEKGIVKEGCFHG